MIKSFNALTNAARGALAYASSELLNDKTGISQLAGGELERVSMKLTWYAEKWMAASQKYDWGMYLAKSLELALVELYAEPIESEDELNIALDLRAVLIVRELIAKATYDLMTERGTFNGVYAMEDKIKRDTLRWVLEYLCGMTMLDVGGSRAAEDIMAGIAKREAEREAARANRVSTIRYQKVGAVYSVVGLNHKNEVIAEPMWRLVLTRKGDVLTQIAKWVVELQQVQGSMRIAVEEVK